MTTPAGLHGLTNSARRVHQNESLDRVSPVRSYVSGQGSQRSVGSSVRSPRPTVREVQADARAEAYRMRMEDCKEETRNLRERLDQAEEELSRTSAYYEEQLRLAHRKHAEREAQLARECEDLRELVCTMQEEVWVLGKKQALERVEAIHQGRQIAEQLHKLEALEGERKSRSPVAIAPVLNTTARLGEVQDVSVHAGPSTTANGGRSDVEDRADDDSFSRKYLAQSESKEGGGRGQSPRSGPTSRELSPDLRGVSMRNGTVAVRDPPSAPSSPKALALSAEAMLKKYQSLPDEVDERKRDRFSFLLAASSLPKSASPIRLSPGDHTLDPAPPEAVTEIPSARVRALGLVDSASLRAKKSDLKKTAHLKSLYDYASDSGSD